LNKLTSRKIYLEKYIPFKKELATQVVRTTTGEIKVYPIVETIQKNNICHIVIAPAKINKKIQLAASKLAKKTVAKLKGAGVFGIEMFLTKNNEVLVNEIAPRVHNSGHYTIEGAQTSQFEQHVRAVCKMPLGKVKMTAKSAVMINILGERNGKASLRGIEKVQNTDGAFIHIYDKLETRNERKMGHITVVGQNPAKTLNLAKKLRKEIFI
jgi:phosphoribosylaminoimidazole carboxylase PurK protein